MQFKKVYHRLLARRPHGIRQDGVWGVYEITKIMGITFFERLVSPEFQGRHCKNDVFDIGVIEVAEWAKNNNFTVYEYNGKETDLDQLIAHKEMI